MKWFTTKQVATELGICRETVAALIRSGQLAAINVSLSPSSRRPRYRVSERELETFKRERSVERSATQRRSHRTTSYTRFV